MPEPPRRRYSGGSLSRAPSLGSFGSFTHLPGLSALTRAHSGLGLSALSDMVGGRSLRAVPSELMMAVAKPVGSLSSRILGALPADLGTVLREAADVFLSSVFDHGSRRATERRCSGMASIASARLTKFSQISW